MESGLKFSIVYMTSGSTAETCWGRSVAVDQEEIRIRFNATFIWPLLVNRYSASETVAHSFQLTASILHELAVSQHHKHIPLEISR